MRRITPEGDSGRAASASAMRVEGDGPSGVYVKWTPSAQFSLAPRGEVLLLREEQADSATVRDLHGGCPWYLLAQGNCGAIRFDGRPRHDTVGRTPVVGRSRDRYHRVPWSKTNLP